MSGSTVKLTDALMDVQNHIREAVGEQLKTKKYSFCAEVTHINPKFFGSNQYVDVTDPEGLKLQLIVPVTEAKRLELHHMYQFVGCFEITNKPKFGFYQFRVSSCSEVGKTDWVLEKEKVWKEIQNRGFLNRYQYDFTKMSGKASCRIALVTSEKSQVIKDIEIVLQDRPGINLEVVPVRLNDKVSIANGITEASNKSYDVIMLVRGGGQPKEFEVFNSIEVVEAIYHSKIPVIVALGHTDNKTYADLVADKSLPTPTSAAKFLHDVIGTPINQQKMYEFPQYKKQYVHESRKTYQAKKSKGLGCLAALVSLFGALMAIPLLLLMFL
ncbi:hypothetical protein G3578_07285 [Brevibacillus sp. SYP-B805]|uniref:exodeoxyribonuclease VII large subunit n=1 Tax=Brevibacillus sp. SYP-B805 TaxID=1578199 RepID=UPI0013EA34CE|nr:exodeoxyribonuclease VII large subunit [Brevibacillus sp. SYP-B805]NGQ94987.1 hypothetical protein [Brevibacillus sp. SYP-B805]